MTNSNPDTPPEAPVVTTDAPREVPVVAAPPPNDNRRRLRDLLSIPERDRSDEQWDEIIELEIQLAPGNRISGNEQGAGHERSSQFHGKPGGGSGQQKKHRPRPNNNSGGSGPGGSGGGGNSNNRRPRQHNKPPSGGGAA